MRGSVRCIHCNSGIDEQGNGVCPSCNAAKGYWIDVYWSKRYGGDGKHHSFRFGLDWASTKVRLDGLRCAIADRNFDPLDGQSSPKNSFTRRVDEWFIELERAVVRKDIAPGTYKTYLMCLDKVLPALGDLDVAKIDYQALKDCLDDLNVRGTTKRTIRGNIRTFFVWCRRKKYVNAVPPFPVIKGIGRKIKYVLTQQQQEEALSRLPVLQDAFRLMASCGIRPSEVLLIKISDVNPSRHCITINRTYSNSVIKQSTKGNRPRTLPLSAGAWEIVARNIGNRVGDQYLFCKADGQPYSYHHLWFVWTAYSGTKVPPKDATRRSWATRMRNAGVQMDAIRQGLGHTDLQTTKEYLEDDVEWAADQFNAADAKIIPLNGYETGFKEKP